MHPLDEAAIFRKLLENGEAIKTLAKRFDRTVSAIYQRIQLLDLSDGIKELFRDGKLDLHAAAMLKSLDIEQQKAFYDKFQKQKDISIWDVKGFISKVRHDKLYSCLAGKDCAACKKRTFYSDKALFPELGSEDDLCLEHECYMKKWKKLLSARIKQSKTKSKNHEGANIIASDNDELHKIFGKKITLDKTEYTIVKITLDNRPSEKQSKNLKPCFQINISRNYRYEDGKEQVFLCEPAYWKEPEKKKAQTKEAKEESRFAPAVRLLGLSKDEEETAVKAFEADKEKMSYWQLDSKLQQKAFWYFMEERAKKEPSADDIDWYLRNVVFDRISDVDIKIFKVFMGKDYFEEQIPDLITLPVASLFKLLSALTFNANNMPDPGDLEANKSDGFLRWLGADKEELRELYRQEIAKFMPKQKAAKPETSKKPGKAKTE